MNPSVDASYKIQQGEVSQALPLIPSQREGKQKRFTKYTKQHQAGASFRGLFKFLPELIRRQAMPESLYTIDGDDGDIETVPSQ